MTQLANWRTDELCSSCGNELTPIDDGNTPIRWECRLCGNAAADLDADSWGGWPVLPLTAWRTDEPCPTCGNGLTLLDDGDTPVRWECRLCGDASADFSADGFRSDW